MTKQVSRWIIYRLIIGMVLISASSSFAIDPKSKHEMSAAGYSVGAIGSFAAAKVWASVPEPTGATKVLAWSAAISGVLSLANAGLELNERNKLDNAPNFNSGNFSIPKIPTVPTGSPTQPRLPTGTKTPNSNDYTNAQKVSAQYQAALVQKEEIMEMLKNLENPAGPSLEEMANNPEKYLTPEEMAQYNEEKAKMETELEERLASQDASDFDSYLSSLNFSSLGNQGGVFAPSFGEFKLDDFFKMTELGIENSAPGYYGNMKLESLKPHSKKSLFERVSDKIKKIM